HASLPHSFIRFPSTTLFRSEIMIARGCQHAKPMALPVFCNDLEGRIDVGALAIVCQIAYKKDDLYPGISHLLQRGTEGRNALVEDRKSTRLNSSHVKISYAV